MVVWQSNMVPQWRFPITLTIDIMYGVIPIDVHLYAMHAYTVHQEYYVGKIVN